MNKTKFDEQFKWNRGVWLSDLDFLNWYRYFFIIKEIINISPANVLEIGTGSGIVKSCLQPNVAKYTTLDISSNLAPDIVGDVRDFHKELEDKFECAIVADVLEHIPFADIEKSLNNINSYLRDKGKLIVTIPHRRSNFLFMSPTYKPHVFTVPTGFLSFGAFYRRFIKRKIWIDPYHCWEMGDGRIKRKHVESAFFKAGFIVDRFQKLLYVDFWVLRKT